MFFADVFFYPSELQKKAYENKKKITYTLNCLCHVLIPLICLHYTLLQKKILLIKKKKMYVQCILSILVCVE